jgi:uncharacterized membrane protein YeaQ/YmgE (transglycosylase-associated protein family)
MQDIPQMTLVTWIVVGAIAGFLASVIAGSREGLLMMVILGIVGAVVGGWIADQVLKVPGMTVTGINATSIIVAVAGALIVLFVVNSLGGRRRAFSRS